MGNAVLPTVTRTESVCVGGLDRECLYISDLILALQTIQSSRGDIVVECHNEAGDYDNVRSAYVKESRHGTFCRISPCGEDQ